MPPETQGEVIKGSGHRTALLWVASVSAFVNPFLSSALNLAVPSIGEELHAPPIVLSWIVAAFLVASAVAAVPAGRLADILGRKRIFIIGNVVLGLMCLAASQAHSVGALIAFRLLQGLGCAMSFSTAVALLTSAFPVGERGRVLGINTAAVYVGLSVGPVAGGFLTQALGWHSIFILVGLLALVAAILAFVFVPSNLGHAKGERMDVSGSLIYALGLGGLMIGASTLRKLDFAPWLLIGGLGVLALFVMLQLRSKQPLLNLRLFSNRVFAFSNLAALINYSATFAVTFMLSIYLQTIRGFSARTAGLILLTQPIVMAVLSPLAGKLSDRIEPRRVASLGMTLCCCGVALMALLGASTPIYAVVAALLLLGTGFGLFSSPNTNAVMSAVEQRSLGVAAATLGTMRLVGQALSMAIVSVILAFVATSDAASSTHTAELLVSVRVSFSLFAGLCFVGIFASLSRGHLRK